MSDCVMCPVESECAYPYKPCDCVHQRKFVQREHSIKERFINFIGVKARSAKGTDATAMCILHHLVSLIDEKLFTIVFEQNFQNKDDFDEGWYDFHKSLRQTDFYDNGHLDMIFWEFIHLSDIPYKIFKMFVAEEKINIES